MADFKDIILAVLAILIPAIVAILGYVIHRKTERMESQLSDKKYHAYAGLVDMFFKILKDTKRNNVPNDNLAEQMVDLRKIFFCMVLIKYFLPTIIFLIFLLIILEALNH